MTRDEAFFAFGAAIGDFGNYRENGCACGVFRGCGPQHCIYAAARALAEGGGNPSQKL